MYGHPGAHNISSKVISECTALLFLGRCPAIPVHPSVHPFIRPSVHPSARPPAGQSSLSGEHHTVLVTFCDAATKPSTTHGTSMRLLAQPTAYIRPRTSMCLVVRTTTNGNEISMTKGLPHKRGLHSSHYTSFVLEAHAGVHTYTYAHTQSTRKQAAVGRQAGTSRTQARPKTSPMRSVPCPASP